ncbi:MAG: hypothetical protein EOP38_05160 [Rubrivivax sp.]|nr:MAG: hypothetical protein EOP38_05160 [Rubrivivax sp.]
MFERAHHQRIGRLLQALDALKLRELGCLFGGGTAMALRFGEYRESVDVDFLVSDQDGYRELRNLLRGSRDLGAISRPGVAPPACRNEIRVDQYGIRTHVMVDETAIKFEIVNEGRIVLEAPGRKDEVLGVSTLSPVDMVASKLLANSDRGLDDGTFNRDLLDLAMTSPPLASLAAGHAKASAAYGQSVAVDFHRAIARLRDREGWLERCMAAMQVRVPVALVWQRLRTLERRMAGFPSKD